MVNAAKKINHDTSDIFADELQPGEKLMHGQYTIESFLGSGGFGITYLARDSLNRLVVIKECFPGAFCRRKKSRVAARSRAHQAEFKSIVKLFYQEARSMSKLVHPNIVGVHQVFEDNDTAYMALDYIEGFDLLETLEEGGVKLAPEDLRKALHKILGAVAFIHDNNILHRDISPDNILINKTTKEPMLIDFGAAREEVSKQSRVLSALRVVKDGYSPQEFYINGSMQGPSSDLYALGASFYHLITDAAAIDSQTRLSALAAKDPDPYVPLAKTNKEYDRAFLSAIDKAMNVFPKDRWQSAEEWQKAISGNVTDLKSGSKRQKTSAGNTASNVSPKVGKTSKLAGRSIVKMLLVTTALVAVGVVIFQPKSVDKAMEIAATKLGTVSAIIGSEGGSNPASPVVTVKVDQAAQIDVDPVSKTTMNETHDSKEQDDPTPPVIMAKVDLTDLTDGAPVVGTVVLAPEIHTPIINPEINAPNKAVAAEILEQIAENSEFIQIINGAILAEPDLVLDVPEDDVALDTSSIVEGMPKLSAVKEDADDNAIATTVLSDEIIEEFDAISSKPSAKPVKADVEKPNIAASDAALVEITKQLEVLQAAKAEKPVISFNETGIKVVPSVILPFSNNGTAKTTIAMLDVSAPEWMQVGQKITGVNGIPIQSFAEIGPILHDLVDLNSATVTEIVLTIMPYLGANPVHQPISLEVAQDIILPTGLVFQTRIGKDGQKQTIATTSGYLEGGLNAGDILRVYMPTGEKINTDISLLDVLKREVGKNINSYSFAASRNDAMWIVSFDLMPEETSTPNE